MTEESAGPRITIRDVAKAAGVSTATVSKVMNATGRVSEGTRETVLKAAKSLDFRPNAMARALQSRRSYSAGLLTDDTYGRFSLPLMAGVTEGLIGKGMSVFLCGIDGPPELGGSHLDRLLQNRVDGLIISGRRVDRLPDIDLSGAKLPIVYALSRGPVGGVTLAPDEEHGASLAVTHLLDIGRRRIAHVTGPRRYQLVEERARAWRDTLAAADLLTDAEPLFGDWSELWGHAAIGHLFDGMGRSDRPDAIFCGSDQIGRGVIDALRERGISVPDDVAVIGFDNWRVMAEQTRPPLSSIDMNLTVLGLEVGLALSRLIAGERQDQGLIRLPCTLVPRASTIGTGA